jgi:hypothetical protein
MGNDNIQIYTKYANTKENLDLTNDSVFDRGKAS